MIDTADANFGVVTVQAAAEALAEQPETAPTRIAQLAKRFADITTDGPLAWALHTLLSVARPGLPVLDREKGKPVDWLNHQCTLRALHTATLT